jgi:hypothetical protein
MYMHLSGTDDSVRYLPRPSGHSFVQAGTTEAGLEPDPQSTPALRENGRTHR